jgi:hypothetical protein
MEIEVNKKAYLQDGREVYVKEIIPGAVKRAVINYVNVLYHYNDDPEEILDDEDVLVDVDSLLEKPPTGKYHDEIESAKKRITEHRETSNKLSIEVMKLRQELKHLQQTQIDESNFVINLSNLRKANRIVFFEKNRAIPGRVLDGEKWYRGVKISVEIDITYGKPVQRAWGYKMWKEEGQYSSGNYLCEKYGFLCDPTDEEVDAVTVKRLDEFKFDDYQVANVPDEILQRCKNGEALLARKNEYNANTRKKKMAEALANKEKLESQIESLKTELEKYETN